MRVPTLALTLGLALLLLAPGPAGAWGRKKEAAKEEVAQGENAAEETHFWYNQVTGESQWDFPTYEFVSDEGTEYYVDPVTKKTVWEKPDSLFWEVVEDAEKGTYYYNSKTGESVWDKPAMLGWEQVPVDHSEL